MIINENLYPVCVVVCSYTPGTEHTTTETGYIHVHLTINCSFATFWKRGLSWKKVSNDQILTAQHTHMHTPVSPCLPTQICIKIRINYQYFQQQIESLISLPPPPPPSFWRGGGERGVVVGLTCLRKSFRNLFQQQQQFLQLEKG